MKRRVLPRVRIAEKGKATVLELGGEIICHDYGRFIEDEKEFEDEHDEAEDVGVPPLTVLAIRCLHKAGRSFAKGGCDASSIILKAMQQQKD
mmetsp:Transcript_7843/g.21789  ORF Transcript_7843/g.21789 Transcript_7843/m.21789 type:complete len:92 (-) Transcript_7843:2275-2550(-)